MGTFTLATGLGMLAVGVIIIAIMGLVGLKVINTMEKNRIEQEKRKEREKIYGSN
jgi:hypothetical protein